MNVGSPAENRTATILVGFDYLVASRRHVAGPGDLLALAPPARRLRPLLIEVKRTSKSPWQHFGREARFAMMGAGVDWNVTPLLAWYGMPGPIGTAYPIFLPVSDWPE